MRKIAAGGPAGPSGCFTALKCKNIVMKNANKVIDSEGQSVYYNVRKHELSNIVRFKRQYCYV